jgi:thiosulfate/3-mercaptopyruvate sulfurtransferase
MADYAKDVLVTTEWLAEHLSDGSVVVAEVDENPDVYREGHLAGAVKLHWRDDLQDPVERDLVDRERFERLLGERGIANDSTVALYGDKNNWFAAFAYWYLKIYGARGRAHPRRRSAEVDRRRSGAHDGRALAAASPVPCEPARRVAARLPRRRQGGHRLARGGARGRAQPAGVLGRARLAARIRAGGRPAGRPHPDRQSIPWAQAVRDDGTFKPREELAELYESKGVTPAKEVTAYCRIGERSAHTWFVLRELLGYEEVRNYDGSWTEWGNLVDVPIEKGP